MTKYSASELGAVRIFGGVLLGIGLMALLTSVPTLYASYQNGRFQTRNMGSNPKSQNKDQEPRQFIPGLAGAVFGITFGALGIAALLAARRELSKKDDA